MERTSTLKKKCLLVLRWDGGARQAAVCRVTKRQTQLKRLSTHAAVGVCTATMLWDTVSTLRGNMGYLVGPETIFLR